MCVDESCRLRRSSGEMGKGRHRTPLGASPRDRVRLRERGRVCGCACACWSAGACACVFEGSRSVLLQSQSSRFSSPPVLLPESHTPLPRTHGHPACSPLARPGASRCPAKQMASPGDAQRRSGDPSWLRVKGVSPLTWHAAYTKQKRPLCVYAPRRKIKSYLLHCK